MAKQLTADDAKQSLTAHVAAKGEELRAKYGPVIGWNELLLILEDRSACRYPCELAFDAGPLQPGEFAFPAPKGERPEEGFVIYVHPRFECQKERVPYLVLYQLVQVNYGEFVSSTDAEIFGSSVLGLNQDEYYEILCEMADELEEAHGNEAGGCGGGCHCH